VVVLQRGGWAERPTTSHRKKTACYGMLYRASDLELLASEGLYNMKLVKLVIQLCRSVGRSVRLRRL
jgi:hypothetical protein